MSGKNFELIRGLRDSAANAVLKNMEEKTRGDSPAAWPFIYPFIPYPFLKGFSSSQGNDTYTLPTGVTADGPDGLTIAAGAFLDVGIAIRNDADYHLLQIKYTAWNVVELEPGASALNGTREFLTPPQTSLQGSRTLFVASANQRRPWTSVLSAQAYTNSGRDLYGGLQTQAQNQQKSEVLMPLQSVQGSQDGPGQMRLAALLERNGFLSIRVFNRSATALRVNGHAFGYAIP